MADYHFTLDALTVGYDGKPLIRDINVGIGKGEIITLIGPNGAGKSTILKSITRQLSWIGGSVLHEDRNLKSFSWKEIAEKMAVMLTERMHPELMTCHDVAASGRYPYTGRLGILTAEDERKVDEALRAVRAEELGPKDFNAISDGQKQRVLLARAFCQEPDILVLDEPTSFLDVRHKLDLLSILKNMAEKNGITVILSLHEIDLAMKISDKILCVKGDRIFAYGTPDEIFREDRIRDLYDIDNGFFDPLFGSIELPRITGEPEVFVISSGGTGIPVYRRLQKERKAFACGPLWTNDVDYRLAQLLAAEIVTVEPFCPLSGEIVEKAKEMMDRCGCVINAGVEIGPGNEAVRELLSYAKEKGYLVI